jgi:hypothetical protein
MTPHPTSALAAARALAAALALAGWGAAGAADDAMGNLGSAFRPQPLAVAPPTATAQGGANPAALAASDAERPAANANGLGLRVVVSGPGRSLASIDGKIVHVGDTVNGMRVTEIGPHGVVMVGEGGARERLMLNPAAVKRAPPAVAAQESKGTRP